MKIRLSRYVVPAVLAATIPAAAVFAQTQGQNQPPARSAGPSAETLTRLQDGRIAMIKGALKLNDQQLKLWAPVEEQMRSSFTARQQARSRTPRAASAGRQDRASIAARPARSRQQAHGRSCGAHEDLRRGDQAVLRIPHGRSEGRRRSRAAARRRLWPPRRALGHASRAPRRAEVATEGARPARYPSRPGQA